jgi:hypothetical protein
MLLAIRRTAFFWGMFLALIPNISYLYLKNVVFNMLVIVLQADPCPIYVLCPPNLYFGGNIRLIFLGASAALRSVC